MHQKGSATIILVILIAVLLLGGVGYVYVSEQQIPATAEKETLSDLTKKESGTTNGASSAISKTSEKKMQNERGAIIVEAPNGGETMQVGHTHTFAWRSEGANKSRSVEIHLLRKSPGDSQFWNVGTLGTGQEGSGQFGWTVEMPAGSSPDAQYRILVGRALARGDGESDQTDGYFNITPIPNYPGVCETGKEDKNFCYANSPLFNEKIIDVAFCDKIVVGPDLLWLKVGCINSVAKNRSDVSLCAGSRDTYGDMYKGCFQGIANKTKDLGICKMNPPFSNTAEKDVCYSSVAGANHDISICDLVSAAKGVGDCYYSARSSNQKGDVSICEKIITPYYRNQCFFDAAVFNDDVNMCKKIDPSFELYEMHSKYVPYDSCLERFK